MRLALSDGVSGTRCVMGGSKAQPRCRVVARAAVEGEASDALGGVFESLKSAAQSAPAPAPEPAPVAAPPPVPAPAPATPSMAAPTPAPEPPVVPSNPDLPSIESLAKKIEYPSPNAASTVAPKVDANPFQPLLDALNSAEMAVEDAFDDTAEAIINNFNSLALPPSLQTKADAVTKEYAGAKASFDDAPEVYLFLVALAVGAVTYAYWRNEYGGFSGIYKPTELIEALNKEDNIIVVDIRSEEEQDQNGVLDLRRAARGKAVSLPIVEVPDAVKGDVRNSGLLQRKLSAALVCSLANVNAFTKIVLMDTRGGSTKPLARDISSQGYRAYCLKGGYTLWRRTGLSTKKGTYDVSAADLLADKGEELGEAATSTANELKKPQNAALGVLALLGLCTTGTYPHESFQFFGFVGLQLTVILTFLSYDKPEDAMAALNQSSRSFADKVGSAASSAGSKVKGPAAAAGAAVAEAESKAAKKQENAPKAAVAEDSKPKSKPAVKTMFVNTSAENPAPAAPASNKPSPSKEQKAAPFVPSAAKAQPADQKEDKSSKKKEKKQWPASIAAAATEAASIAQDVPKPVVEIVDKSGDGSKNGNAKGKGGVKSEKS